MRHVLIVIALICIAGEINSLKNQELIDLQKEDLRLSIEQRKAKLMSDNTKGN